MSLTRKLKNSLFSNDNYTEYLKNNETITLSLIEVNDGFYLVSDSEKETIPLKKQDGTSKTINLMNNPIKPDNIKSNEIKLESTNNVILNSHIKSKFILKGNRKDNVLDAGAAKASINGYGGNDHLVISSGVARGGDGDDNYYLRRYQWENIKHNNVTRLNARIVETSKGKSEVHLGYSLKEIDSVSQVGNDLLITIKAKSPYNKSDTLELKLTLKNSYQDHLIGKAIKHHYQLYTQDGFSLTPILKNNSYMEDMQKLYEITYLQDSDYAQRDASDSVRIHKENNYIVINNQGYTPPIWGEFNFNGDITNLTYFGSKSDDILTMLNRNSYIMATGGNDIYQLKPNELRQSKLTVDLSKIEEKSANGNSIIIKIPDAYGCDLYADGQSVYFKNNFGDKITNIKFINYENSKCNAVYIKDANENLFEIKLRTEGHKIVDDNIANLLTSESDDVHLLSGRRYPDMIIDTLAGDDNIEEYSGIGIIVNSGSGNDKIKVTTGVNVFYGGDGDNVIEGGNQGDLLLSDLGNDKLNGKKGNDHYIVDGSIGSGTTVINDKYGINNIHLMHFNKNYVIKKESGFSYRVYGSKSNLREVKIKIIPSDKENKNYIHHYDTLPHHIPNDVKESMSHMVRYLAEHKQYWKREQSLLPWQPMYAFKGFFKNTSYDFIDLSKPKVNISQGFSFKQLVIDLKGNSVDLIDNSGHGRFYKTEIGTGKILIPRFSRSNNVLYAGKGHAELAGGGGDDVFIINGSNSKVSDKKGDNIFIIDGGVRGRSSIRYGDGNNEIHLISFNKTPTIVKTDNNKKEIQYIYQSKSGYKAKIIQGDGLPEPTVIHHNLLPGLRDHTTQQKLEYLGNALAAMRLQDEYNSLGITEIKQAWDPASIVRVFMGKGTG
ncbi:calcium-binding protein [Providencia rettgeri]|uniref:calcium-binding protein n=1 Tax=Providencia rettgeri TaxID=587 RepID=UPI0034E0D924